MYRNINACKTYYQWVRKCVKDQNGHLLKDSYNAYVEEILLSDTECSRC
jgi:hypothetical protein